MLAVDIGAGFLSGIVSGMVAGIFAQYLKKISLPSVICSIGSIIVIPIISTFITSAVLMWGVGAYVAAAIATTIAPKKYSEEERQVGKSAFFMSLVGVTEGAIPFAANASVRVIPCLMTGTVIGAAIGALLVNFFKKPIEEAPAESLDDDDVDISFE